MVNRSIVTMVLLIGAMIVCLTQQIGCFVTASNPPILSVWRTPADSILDPVASFLVLHRFFFGSTRRVWGFRVPSQRFRIWSCLV